MKLSSKRSTKVETLAFSIIMSALLTASTLARSLPSNSNSVSAQYVGPHEHYLVLHGQPKVLGVLEKEKLGKVAPSK